MRQFSADTMTWLADVRLRAGLGRYQLAAALCARAARCEPDRPALDFFNEDELTAMSIDMKHPYKFTDTRAPPFDDLTIRQATIDVGRTVGFIPTRRQPLPGTEKIRKGMTDMLMTAAAYRSFKRQQSMTVSTVMLYCRLNDL
ncbi:MAG: hypothetical protein OXE84_12045 [Rhodobacteraceae bacterium]|nr:hypothetical protein [Paracoccaceae bacterium]